MGATHRGMAGRACQEVAREGLTDPANPPFKAGLVAQYLGLSRTHALGVRRCAVACGHP